MRHLNPRLHTSSAIMAKINVQTEQWLKAHHKNYEGMAGMT